MISTLKLRSVSLVAGVALALTLAGATPSTGVAARDADRPPSTAARHAIDTTSKNAVAKAWRSRMQQQLRVKPGWTGSTRPCRAGHPSGKANRATLSSINFARALAGLDRVVLQRTLSSRAQKAALIMAANKSLSHDPPKGWRCWSRAGHHAAGKSNLALSWPRITAGGAVEMYLTDGGSSNTAVGHRRWVLNPDADKFGNGLTSTSNALYVLGRQDSSNTDPDWVPWPTAGFFPAPLEPNGRWSLSSGADGADFSAARVTVTRGAATLSTTTYPVKNGYGQATLVFDVQGLGETGTYDVTVSNIRGAAGTSHSWRVKLFRP